MINKNLIKIVNLNQHGEKIVIFGKFDLSELQKMINIAEKNNMSCLGLIDEFEDTYFNEEQCMIIKNELKILNTHKNLNKNLLNTLLKAAEASIKSESYIKIEGYKG